MGRIFFYIFIILILALIAYVLREKLGSKTKPFFGILLVLMIVFAVFYEMKNIKNSNLAQEIIVAFNQGKEITCRDFNVSNKYFNYEFGTGSFVSKDNNESFKSLIIDVRNCEL